MTFILKIYKVLFVCLTYRDVKVLTSINKLNHYIIFFISLEPNTVKKNGDF